MTDIAAVGEPEFHIGISVQDITRATRFYERVLDFQPLEYFCCSGPEFDTLVGEREVTLEAQFLRRSCGLTIELLCFSNPPSVQQQGRRPMFKHGFTHLSLRLSDLTNVLQRVAPHGGKVIEETRATVGGVESVYCLDPDGTSIQLTQKK